MTQVLGITLARLLTKRPGLMHLSLPKGIATSTLESCIVEANKVYEEDTAFIIERTASPNFSITPERAASLRSREDGSDANSLVVARSGEFRDIKTLETFRHVNPSSLPSGIVKVTDSDIHVDGLASELTRYVVELLVSKGTNITDSSAADLASAVKTVFIFLGEAYSNAGNGDLPWKDAWWLHVEFLSSRLLESVEQILVEAPSSTYPDIAMSVYGAAGIPVPAGDPAAGYVSKHSAKEFALRIERHWSKGEEAVNEILKLEKVAKDGGRLEPADAYELNGLGTDWGSSFDLTMQREGHAILATSMHGSDSPSHISAWNSVEEHEFFDEIEQEFSVCIYHYPDLSTNPVELPKMNSESETYVVVPRYTDLSEDFKLILLGQFQIQISNESSVDPVGEVEIACSPTSLVAEVKNQVANESGTHIVDLLLSVKLPTKGSGKWREKPFKVVLRPLNRGLGNAVALSPIELTVAVAFPGDVSFYPSLLKGTKKTLTPMFLPDRVYSINRESSALEIDDDENVRVLKSDGSSPSFDLLVTNQTDNLSCTSTLSEPKLKTDLYSSYGKLPLQDGFSIFCDEKSCLTVEIEDSSTRPLSPITAAAQGLLPGSNESGDMEARLLNDIRGCIESNWLLQYIESPFPRDGEVLPLMFAVNEDCLSGNLSYRPENGIHFLGRNDFFPGATLPSDTTVEIDEFWKVFKELGLKELAIMGGGITSNWPSRISLLSLSWELIDNYLKAYSKLLDLAASNNDWSLSAFPFSALVYSPSTGELDGILLSPLHPIRLAWNWSAQQAASEAFDNLTELEVQVEHLLRFIDGSNIPFGAKNPLGNTPLVSRSLEAGTEELFVTWSYLADSSRVNQGSASPLTVAGHLFPGGASSGLDRGGVAAALNDYIRVHPYVTELRLGMFSQYESSRSADLDTAIVSELSNLMCERIAQLPGGISVYDSPNRQGKAPSKDEILYTVKATLEKLSSKDDLVPRNFPFQWRREDPNRADVMFVEDALIKSSYSAPAPDSIAPSGATNPKPLSRFHCWSRSDSGTPSSSYVATISTAHDNSYVEAVVKIESMGGASAVSTIMPMGAVITQDQAKWIVSGNTDLDPWLLAKVLEKAAPVGKVLWEWRPPYMPRRWRTSNSGIMAARPYTVMASLGNEFLAQVKTELLNTLGKTDDILLRQLFNELGARGVGIASLLAMGHSQSRGAIGFFLAFKLAAAWEQNATEEEIRVALPLDAVNPIFETLAGVISEDDRKKADLLLITAVRQPNESFSLKLGLVEIKLHATNEAEHQFPSSTNIEVIAALAQLKSSEKLMSKFVDLYGNTDRPILVENTLASLIQTGLALSRASGGNTQLESDLLNSVTNGRCKYHLGTSTLLWFERNGQRNNKPFDFWESLPGGASAARIYLDPAKTIEEILNGAQGIVIERVTSLFEKGSFAVDEPTQGNESTSQPETDQKGDGIQKHEQAEPKLAIPTKKPETDSVILNTAENIPAGLDSLNKLTPSELESRYKTIQQILEINNIHVSEPAGGEPVIEGPASIIYRVQPPIGTSPKSVYSQKEVLELGLGLASDHNIHMYHDLGCVIIDVPKNDNERFFVDANLLWSNWQSGNSLEVPIGITQKKDLVTINFSSSTTPHLLIGGTTGGGKSEALNTILTGLIRFFTPEQLRLILVDPKGVELQHFKDSKFLEGEIGLSDQSAIDLLEVAFEEMEKRYALFNSAKTKNLASYNEKVSQELKLPWWLVVLDEYADLTADKENKKKIESTLKRLTQKARAAGIHVIIATQKPSVDVINTVLRSNLPAQLALSVKNSTESKVVMDKTGAENLTGKGDAFLHADGKLTRVQCAICDTP